jgi:co-chaperonin GroES (HSP10)
MIKPYGNRILGELLTVSELTTDSGILLGEERAPQSVRLNVLAVGPDVKFTAVEDVVVVSAFAPTETREKRTDKTVTFSEDDILGKITNE